MPRPAPPHRITERLRILRYSPAESHDQIDGPTAPPTLPSGHATTENGIFTPMTLNGDSDASQRGEDQRPPLPPRSSLLQTTNQPATPTDRPSPALQSQATTAVSSVDIQILSFPDGSRAAFSSPASRTVSESLSGGQSTPSRKASHNGSEVGADDSASLMSYAPTLRGSGDLASLLDEGFGSQSMSWKLLSLQTGTGDPFETVEYANILLVNFEHEFDEIEAVDSKEGANEGKSHALDN
jgi:hypothetical protein